MQFYHVKKDSGFKMEGYYIWCGSCIKGDDGMYYLFASRWPKSKGFPKGYMTDSEIVLAKTESLDKPFRFVKVLIGKRDGGYWDSLMAHNPFVIKFGSKYVLFYIGRENENSAYRKIGYAVSDRICGNWERSDQPLDLPGDVNNPCAFIGENGKMLLYYRDKGLKVSVAESDGYDCGFKLLKTDLFCGKRVEDMFVYRDGEKIMMLCEDADGSFSGLKKGGILFSSSDGINFEYKEKAYDFDVCSTDGKHMKLQRRERPFILFDGGRQFLFSSAKYGGEEILTGGDTWNMVQEIKTEER